MSKRFSGLKSQTATPLQMEETMTTVVPKEEQYAELASINLTRADYEVLRAVSFHPSQTVAELQSSWRFLMPDAEKVPVRKTVRSLTARVLLCERETYINLTRVGWVLLQAADLILHPTRVNDQQAAEPVVEVALWPSPQIEGRVILTLSCDYCPLCSEPPALGGILVTFVNGPNPDRDHRVELEHRNYCCELHAAFDLLRRAADGGIGHDELVDMARRSLNGEPMLGDRVSQSKIAADVDRILGSGDQA